MKARTVSLLLGAAGATLVWRAVLRSRRRIDFGGRVVVITGGSRGLGLELARLFAVEGARIALLARDAAALQNAVAELEAGGADVLGVACDVGHRKEVNSAIDRVLAHFGQIDVLVNNAGLMDVGPVETMRYDQFHELMRVHAWGPLYLTRAVLGPMRRRPGARIVNIVSIGGKVAVPHMAPYSMSKFALSGLSDGLRAELAGLGIRVTTVYPGLMRTGSHVQVRFHGQPRREFAWFASSAGSPLLSTSAGSAAQKIVEACRYGDAHLVITVAARVLIAAQMLAPRLVASATALAARLMPALPAPGSRENSLGWDARGGPVVGILTARAERAIAPMNQRRASP
jgi:NAD(P)-dependent dehydrogenase (short-subunit alcohol dehydrogenase family)